MRARLPMRMEKKIRLQQVRFLQLSLNFVQRLLGGHVVGFQGSKDVADDLAHRALFQQRGRRYGIVHAVKHGLAVVGRGHLQVLGQLGLIGDGGQFPAGVQAQLYDVGVGTHGVHEARGGFL